jgi:hypothetical protein
MLLHAQMEPLKNKCKIMLPNLITMLHFMLNKKELVDKLKKVQMLLSTV